MKHFLLTIVIFLALMSPAKAQNPWVGGLNACQFGRMDLDQDGVKDLLVFDRHGNRMLCFLNRGAVGEIDYQYTNAYDEAFPKLNDWVIFEDYDGDGREDIFTFSEEWAGMKVFRNVSTADQVAFELVVSPYLTSFQGGGEVNILATEADFPSIADLDGDGDLDILTFGVFGVFIEMHTNLSVERYGTRDSLVFERTEQCWGRVAESEEDNVMYLDTCFCDEGLKRLKFGSRHRGATVAVRDLNGDGLLDLLLADVDYPGLTALLNGGNEDKALMVSQMDYPPKDPVKLKSMPVPFFTDINNDGIDDLVVSPFDPNPLSSQGLESVWLYLNHGTNQNPDFQLYTKSFLQDDMIDVGVGAYPIFTDWDGDGLMDLKVRDFEGRVTPFRNVGTAEKPAFEQKEGVFDVEGWSAQCYFDVDQDGIMDRVEGQVSGKLTLYRGKGNGYDWVTDSWGQVDVCDYNLSYEGYSVPTLFYYHDTLLLCVGSKQGRLFLYRVSDDDVFEEVGWLWKEICPGLPESFGWHSAAAVADLNGDGVLEVVVGNYAGGLQLFNADIPVVNLGISEYHDGVQVEIFPNPVTTILHIVAPSSLRAERSEARQSTVDDFGLLRCARNDVRVVDLFGRVLIEKELSYPETVIDVSALAPGVYLLNLGLVNRIFLKR